MKSTYTFSDNLANMKPSAIREILKRTADPSIIPFSAGNPAAEAFPVEEVRRITAQVLGESPVLALQYSVSEGYPPLRDAVRKMARERYGVGTPEDDLIITSGAQQGVEMTCKVFCNRGDVLLAEDPSFIGSLNAFRALGARLVGVPMEEDGISVERLEAALRENQNVKLLYVIPNFQNPSGITMSAGKRKAVYDLACKYDIVIIEDNPYGDLRFAGEDIPPIKALDTEGRVVYCGSFSKILSPGLRVGYVLAPKAIVGRMVVAKQCEDVHTTILSQLICERFLCECDLDAHIRRIREIYRKKCGLMIEGIEQNFSPKVRFTRPQGGLFIWCTMPEGSDMLDFCRRAVEEEKVAVVPGTAFMADENTPTTSFRMNYSTPSDENIVRGVELLGRLTKEFVR